LGCGFCGESWEDFSLQVKIWVVCFFFFFVVVVVLEKWVGCLLGFLEEKRRMGC